MVLELNSSTFSVLVLITLPFSLCVCFKVNIIFPHFSLSCWWSMNTRELSSRNISNPFLLSPYSFCRWSKIFHFHATKIYCAGCPRIRKSRNLSAWKTSLRWLKRPRWKFNQLFPPLLHLTGALYITV